LEGDSPSPQAWTDKQNVMSDLLLSRHLLAVSQNAGCAGSSIFSPFLSSHMAARTIATVAMTPLDLSTQILGINYSFVMLLSPPRGSLGIGSVVDDFELLEHVGSGSSGHVYFAQHLPTSNYCAAKLINLSALSADDITAMMREVSVFMQVQHRHICNLYRLSVVDEELVLFMEFAVGGTLLKHVNGCGGLKEPEAQRLFGQLFSAVRHLHACHFLVHRDLKMENVLLDARDNVKLTDFGLSSTCYGNVMRTFVGTGGYQAPEILAGGEYDEKCDVWSLGVCLFAMIECRLPFSTQSHSARMLIDDAERLTFPATFSPLLVDLLRRMFAIHPKDRPSLLQLQTHPWLRSQVQPLAANVAPQPIVFYRVPGARGILKFKRRPVKPDSACVEKCREFGVDPATLGEQLTAGLTTPETTIYFCCLYPLTERPDTKALRQAISEPLIPAARKREAPDIMLDPIASPVRRLSATVRPSQSPVVVVPHATLRGKVAVPRPAATSPKQKRMHPLSPRRC
jgi:hypothetical protein